MSRSKSRRSSRRTLRVVASPPQGVSSSPETIANGDTPPPSLTVVAPPIAVAPLRPGKKPVNPWRKGMMAGIRTGILGIGLGAIAGTALTTFTPTRLPEKSASAEESTGAVIYPQKVWAAVTDWWTTQVESKTSSTPLNSAQKPSPSAVANPSAPGPNAVTPTTENPSLRAKVAQIATQYAPKKVVPHAYFVDGATGQFVNFQGNKPLPAASTIKIPVAIAFFEAVDQGNIKLHEAWALTPDVIASEAGRLQYEKGKKDSYSALEIVTLMMTISDNTATNMVIKRLGGKDAVNKRFKAWQLTHTQLRNPLPDLEGTNTTSPQDLALLLARIQGGEILSLPSRDRLLRIMEQTETRTLLPQGLEPDAHIAHKTGDIGKVLGDAGIIDMPTGQRYVGAVIATRPHNDIAGRLAIQDISRAVYQHFKGLTPPAPAPMMAAPAPSSPKPTPSPSPKSSP